MIVLPIIFAFFVIVFLMVVHEFGHFIIAKKCGVKVEEFGIGYPPRIFGKKIGKTIYSINLIPFGAFVKIPGEIGGLEDYQSFSNLPIYKRVFIVLGGVLVFWLVALVLFIAAFNVGVSVPIDDQTNVASARVQIYSIAPSSPAEASGVLRTGDRILSVVYQDKDYKTTGLQINTVKDFQDFVSMHKGEPIIIWVERNGKDFYTSLVPRENPPAGQGAIGVGLERVATVIEKAPWYQTPFRGLVFCVDLTKESVKGLVGLVFNLVSGKGLPSNASPAGPLGITIFLAKAAELGIGFFLYFIAAVSVLLAIFNLLPIPALDGGKLLFLLIEKIKRGPVSPKIEQTITIIFFFILISLSLFVTIKFDIPRVSEFLKLGV